MCTQDRKRKENSEGEKKVIKKRTLKSVLKHRKKLKEAIRIMVNVANSGDKKSYY